MALQIIPFQSSMNTCYLIKDKGAVLIDGAWPNEAKSFSKFLEKHQIKPEEVQLIILTHGDFDHVGGAKELKELTGASIVIHEMDKENLEKGIFHWPEGVTPWGRFSRSVLKPIIKKKAAFPAVRADIVLDDNGLSLEEYGIPGRIVYTPGHTFGSISVLLDTGDAFIGCLAQNRIPFRMKPGLPIYAKDIELLKKSWKILIDQGAKTIYPGHGKSFPVKKILKYLN
ncbi:MAG: MBL fold metallo-hydrolase [Bacteroidales bacterium]|nr:MBL fold metallo-hydrolase [Bacteroidales bacterium]